MHPIAATSALSLLLALGTAVANPAAPASGGGYTGPRTAPATASASAPGGYAGPSSVPLVTVRQLLDAGKDDQAARLQGRIVSHDGGDRYTFEDATGRITVEIDADRFPPGQPVSAQQRVELTGEFDKGFRRAEFEVERMALLPS